MYTRDAETGLWAGEGHVLLGATSRSLSRRETKELKGMPHEVKLMQHEDEVTYIGEIYVEERLADGRVIRHAPDSGKKQFTVSRTPACTRLQQIVEEGGRIVCAHSRGLLHSASFVKCSGRLHRTCTAKSSVDAELVTVCQRKAKKMER